MASHQPPTSHDNDGILRSLGRLEGRVDLLISNHLPHLHADVMASRRLTMWIGSVLATLMCAIFALLIRVILGP
jgi:hypothetical protein